MRFVLIVFAAWFSLVASAWAVSPLQYTRTTLEEARTVVGSNQTHDQKLTALSTLFGTFLDTDAMGRAALAEHQSSFTPEQQKEFLALFRILLERTYVQKLLLFENPKFTYVNEQYLGDEANVATKIVTARDEFNIAYQLRPTREHWLVTKITVEDVNLTANLASQLDHLLSRMTVEDLLDLLRRKYGRAAL